MIGSETLHLRIEVHRLKDDSLGIVRSATAGTPGIVRQEPVVAELANLKNLSSEMQRGRAQVSHLHTTLTRLEVLVREVQRFRAEEAVWVVLERRRSWSAQIPKDTALGEAQDRAVRHRPRCGQKSKEHGQVCPKPTSWLARPSTWGIFCTTHLIVTPSNILQPFQRLPVHSTSTHSARRRWPRITPTSQGYQRLLSSSRIGGKGVEGRKGHRASGYRI